MSCRICIDSQDRLEGSYWYRWKNANIEIRACRQHAKEIIDALNGLQKQGKHILDKVSEDKPEREEPV